MHVHTQPRAFTHTRAEFKWERDSRGLLSSSDPALARAKLLLTSIEPCPVYEPLEPNPEQGLLV